MKKRLRFIFVSFFLITISMGMVSSLCCQETINGAFCQNIEDASKCKTTPIPSSCELTNECKSGCCFDSQTGECSPGSPEITCNGRWENEPNCDIDACSIGCCVLGNQAFLANPTECKFQSSINGLQTNFQPQIQNEAECVLSVTSDVKGACVYEQDFQKQCRVITKKECMDLKATGQNTSFYEDFLCSAEDLSTICGPSKKTTCYNDKVYFIDTCGNIANIYDSSRIDDNLYWRKVVSVEDSCDYDNNADKCGNCEYESGSVCGTKRVQDETPIYGDFVCRNTQCKYDGKTYEHGERWCGYKDEGNYGTEKNLPGSKHFVMECRDGDILIQECDDYRAQICEEEEVVDDFMTAKCVSNRWQDCTEQEEKKDCLNVDKRDCQWIYTTWAWNKKNKGVCVPEFAPGLKFWDSSETAESSNAKSICSQGTTQCVVTYEKGVSTGLSWKCEKNCWCLEDEWKNAMNKICNSLGDCGVKENYQGNPGYYIIKDLYSKS